MQKQKYKTFIIFLIILSIWSTFFSLIKYYLWGDLDSTLSPDLQSISGYLSVGSIFAYLIGGAISSSFSKGQILGYTSLLALLLVFISNFIGISNNFILGGVLIGIGFLYGLWTIIKNIIIPIEIEKTGLQDTTINAFAGIIFVVFIIIGAIGGSIISENIGHNGYYIHIGILVIATILSFLLKYDNDEIHKGNKIINEIKLSIKEYIPEVKYIIKKYLGVLISIGFLWSISTIISQTALEYSVKNFDKTNSEAGILLLYSAVGAILGNIISMKMENIRWKAFFIFNSLLAVLILLFPIIVNISYTTVIFGAFIIGILFGASSNLIDSYYLHKMGIENKKEYGSSTYGLVLSIIIFLLMFLSSYINSQFGFTILMIILGILISIVSLINYNKK